MQRNAIIIHGKPKKAEYYSADYPSASNFHWIPWLQNQLQINDINTQTPEIPEAHYPQYHIWEAELDRYEVGPQTTLVGHSCGGGFILRWLSENKDIKVDKVILVAPWLDPERETDPYFFDFDIQPDLLMRVNNMTVFYSDNDKATIDESVDQIRDALPDIHYRIFHGYGHFTKNSMESIEFTELRDAILT